MKKHRVLNKWALGGRRYFRRGYNMSILADGIIASRSFGGYLMSYYNLRDILRKANIW